MSRPVTLITAPWLDVRLEDLTLRAAEWGYQGLELTCGGDHFDVPRAVREADYCPNLLAQLEKQELGVWSLFCDAIGQACCDPVDGRHQRLLPEPIWGNGEPGGVQARAADAMMAVFRAAQKMGVTIVSGFTGSPAACCRTDYPPAPPGMFADSLKTFARRWNPILDVARECGVRFALVLHPAQIAYDLYTAEAVLEVLKGREEFGFTIDPSQLHWQGVDPSELVRRFPDRVFHVHVRDASVTLNGRNSLLGSWLPPGDPRRGWDYRSPGHGGIDWSALIRALNHIGYDGALSVAWQDAGMARDHGAAEACQFVKRLDFPSQRLPFDSAFKD